MSDENLTPAVRTAPQTIPPVPCEVYSRVVGYLRPVQNFNEGKRREFHDRIPFTVSRGPA